DAKCTYEGVPGGCPGRVPRARAPDAGRGDELRHRVPITVRSGKKKGPERGPSPEMVVEAAGIATSTKLNA
ncbi:MAG: hypothetical protein U1D69_12560, partial [Polynucleobacter sp.]|nr:hypothetical protein [Polynucleobacter sp.]